jgi:hypothetical protein
MQLRVSFSGVVDWSPALVGLWAEYEAIDLAPRRMRWQLTVRARDRAIQRDGSVDPRSGHLMAGDLWEAWSGAQPLTFTDLDRDQTGRTHAVRIAAINEAIPAPADAAHWGESLVAMELVEV